MQTPHHSGLDKELDRALEPESVNEAFKHWKQDIAKPYMNCSNALDCLRHNFLFNYYLHANTHVHCSAHLQFTNHHGNQLATHFGLFKEAVIDLSVMVPRPHTAS